MQVRVVEEVAFLTADVVEHLPPFCPRIDIDVHGVEVQLFGAPVGAGRGAWSRRRGLGSVVDKPLFRPARPRTGFTLGTGTTAVEHPLAIEGDGEVGDRIPNFFRLARVKIPAID